MVALKFSQFKKNQLNKIVTLLKKNQLTLRNFVKIVENSLLMELNFVVACGVKLDEDAVFDNTILYKICNFW